MKKIFTTIAFLIIIGYAANAQGLICDSTANIIIYSDYDGGVLNINVDIHIPNLKIGVVTYEPVTINITGTYIADVTAVSYAGYYATGNHNCSNTPDSTTIIGVPQNITSINFLPPATYNNPYGDANIVCNYSSSDSTNQGGCNTPDQVVYYFESVFAGTMRYHFTQYNCWNTTPYNVSDGGNCCAVPFTTSINEADKNGHVSIYPNPNNGSFTLSNPRNSQLIIKDVCGRIIYSKIILSKEGNENIWLPFGNGIYFWELTTKDGIIGNGKLSVIK